MFQAVGRSTPNILEFEPLPSQLKVIRHLRREVDYSKGTHEVLLSGSVGCLKGDALIETASGLIPISRIKKSDWLLSYDNSNNRFCFVQGSDAFPKGKGFLYRVTTTRGEFVASGNHHIATLPYTYRSVEDLFLNGYGGVVVLGAPTQKCPSVSQRLLLSSVLSSWKTISSFLYHCAAHIHQCDPQLQRKLNIVRDFFPLQDDVLKFGQFSYKNKPACLDDLLELEQELSRLFEEHGHASMHDLFRLLETQIEVAEGVDSQAYSTLLLRKFWDIQQWMLSDLNSSHPKALLFFCAKLCRLLALSLSSFDSESSTNCSIVSIDKTDKEEWYWDIQVPNTNNYVCEGVVHHNSSKSILLAHMVVTHALLYPKSRVGIGRLALPQLKATLCQKIKEHLFNTNIDYKYHETTGNFDMPNGSEIRAISWADGNFAKLGSLEFSAFAIEELTESKDDKAYDVILQRTNRLPHINEPWVLSGTNPSSPSSVFYKKLVISKSPRVKVFYSNTLDNPYLPKSYIDSLLERLDPKMAQRMVFGIWAEIDREKLYYAYTEEHNLRRKKYQVNPSLPVRLTYDFNIGDGKPLSLVLCQYDPMLDHWHFFDEVIVDGQRTLDSLEEAEARGIIPINLRYIIHGDASGRSRDTRQTRSDYDLIESWLSKKNYRYEVQVPKANPPIRDRHNNVNAYMTNAKGDHRLFVYEDAPTVNEGFLLTRLKPGGQYLEVDTDRFQHCTTACGYAIMYESMMRNYYSKQTYTEVGRF